MRWTMVKIHESDCAVQFDTRGPRLSCPEEYRDDRQVVE